MSAFLVSTHRVAHRMVALEGERHPRQVRELIDGMIREFHLHEAALERGVIVYVPTDLPRELTDAWAMDFVASVGSRR